MNVAIESAGDLWSWHRHERSVMVAWCGQTGVMSDLWDDIDDDDVSPICPHCGVSALPPEAMGEPSMCENPDCSAFGEPIEG